jgi:uncharacterized membrane protein
MFPSIAGLPAHPLIVHLTVVLVPLAALSALAVVVRPRLRARFGPLALAVVAAGLVVAVLAEESGQTLADQLPPSAQITAHAELGESLPALLAVTGLLLGGLLFADRRARRAAAASLEAPATDRTRRPRQPQGEFPRRTASGPLAVVLAVAVGVAALAGLVQVVRIGDTGARATWGDVSASAAPAPRGAAAGAQPA